MIRKIENAIKTHGPMWTSEDGPDNFGPPRIGDKIKVELEEGVQLDIDVEDIEGDMIRGMLVGISHPIASQYEGVQHGEKVEVNQTFIKVINRRT